MKTDRAIKLGVSLYSYQEAIWRGDLDLEGALTAAAGCGGTGVEIFGEALIPSFPHISDEFLYRWFYMMDNLGLEPVCYAHFSDRRYWKDPKRYLSDDDVYDVTVQYLKSAKKLGCKFIRLSHDGHNGMYIMNDAHSHTVVDANNFERLLPVAAELGVKMALEVHGPGLLDDGGNDDFLEVLDRTGLYEGGGLMLDFSGTYRDDPQQFVNGLIARGAKPDVIAYIRKMGRKAYTYDGNNQVDWDEVESKVKEMGGGEIELGYLNKRMGLYGGVRQRLTSPPEVIKKYASQLIYIHGKMHWINEDCTSDEMDYERILKALQEGGYKGYICTEFEGQRMVPHTINEVEFVRRQHKLMRKSLGYE